MMDSFGAADGDPAANLPRTFKDLLAVCYAISSIHHLSYSLVEKVFRRACMRAGIRCKGALTGENAAKLLKLAWATLPWGVFITITGCVFVFWTQALSFSNSYGQTIIFLVNAFACILELLAEPLYIISQNLLLLKLRLKVETVATLLQCIMSLLLCKLIRRRHAEEKKLQTCL